MGILNGKVAVITGSTKGLGLAIARRYAEEGAAVVIASRRQGAVDQVVSALQAEGFEAAGRACDIGDQAQVDALAALAIAAYGHFDIWVNNAGMSPPYGPTIHQDPDAFVSVVKTNILGTYYGSRAAMVHFLERGSGKLVNVVGRGHGGNPVPLQNAYASSKAWMKPFTLALAKEYKDTGVGVFAFNPGMVDTDMLRRPAAIKGFEDRVKMLGTIIPLFGNPPEVPAEKALWLVSPATDGKTGLFVNVGGRFKLLLRAAGYGLRRLAGHHPQPVELDISTVPPAF